MKVLREGAKIKLALIGGVIAIIAVILFGVFMKYRQTEYMKGANAELTNVGEVNENEQNTEKIIGDKAIISSASIISRSTGTGPWDDNDDPGNDSSADNDIVRSFDQVTWTVNLTTAVKEGVEQTSYTGGVIEFTATLPEEFAKEEFAPYMEWDLDSMGWIEDANLNEDGITLTGKYSLSETERTVPGAQTLVFVLKLYGVANQSEFAPTFTFNLAGNEEDEKVTITDSAITVSATGKYNVQLVKNADLESKATVDFGQGETRGRMYGYAFILQLYNDNESKGLKGVEYPQGEISFDIDLKLERSKSGSGVVEDITEDAMPLLWNYNRNYNQDPGLIENREMYGTTHQRKAGGTPSGIDLGDRSYSVYNSGDIMITQENSKLNVTINNYQFDTDFPRYEISQNSDPNRRKIYTDNIGVFSIGYIQLFVPDTEASTQEEYNYYFTVTDTNFNSTSSTEQIINQEVITDDLIRDNHIISSKGTKNEFIDLIQLNSQPISNLNNNGRNGDTSIIRNQSFIARLYTSISGDTDPEYYIHSENVIYKFDGEGLEPDTNEIIFSSSADQTLEFNAYYLTKKDGTNWVSQEEMNNTVLLEDFNVYKNKDDIPEKNIIVGILFLL